MKSFYRPLLQDVWNVCWNNAFLWPLALCASFAGVTVVGTFQVLSDILNSEDFFEIISTGGSDFITSTFVGWSRSFDRIPWSSLDLADIPYLLLFFFLLIIVLILTVIFISSEGGLIYATSSVLDGKKPTYLTSFRRGLDTFWHLFGIYIVYNLLTRIATLLIIVPLLYTAAVARPGKGIGVLTLVYLVLIPMLVILNLVMRYSLMYIVIQGQTIRNAFFNAWLLFRANWVISLETSLVIMAIIAIGFGLFAVVLIPLIVVIITLFGSFLSISSVAFQLFVIFGLMLLLVLVTFFTVFFTSYQMALWVAVFKRLTAGGHASKIHRMTRHLPWLHQRVL